MMETELLNIHLLRCSDNGFAYLPLLEIGVQRSPADGLQQHEARTAARDLLVQRHQLEQALGAERRPGDRQAGPAQQRAHAMRSEERRVGKDGKATGTPTQQKT